MEVTGSNDVKLVECGLVAVEVRKRKVGVRDDEEGWTPWRGERGRKVLDVWVLVN